MAERPRYQGAVAEQPELPIDCADCLSKFRAGVLESRRPTTAIEIKNCKKLFQSGVINLFADESKCIVDPRLEMYFTDDFSKICLREKETREALISVGIGHDSRGAIDIRTKVRVKTEDGEVKDEILSPISANEVGIGVLSGILQGVTISSGFRYSSSRR